VYCQLAKKLFSCIAETSSKKTYFYKLLNCFMLIDSHIFLN
jgi:hypothetical protein